MLKDERVKLTFLPKFTTICFISQKIKTTQTTWESLLCKNVDSETDIEHINTTVVTDWKDFMLFCPEEEAGHDRAARPSYTDMLVMELVEALLTTR